MQRPLPSPGPLSLTPPSPSLVSHTLQGLILEWDVVQEERPVVALQDIQSEEFTRELQAQQEAAAAAAAKLQAEEAAVAAAAQKALKKKQRQQRQAK